MSAEHLSGFILGTFMTVLVLVGLVIIARTVRNRYFPSENEEERSEAMTELLLLQAELQKRAGKGPVSSAEEGGEFREGGGPGGSQALS